MNPADLRLPYPDWTPGQRDLIIQLASSDKPYLLLEAPTGTGKSAVAVALARLLGEKSIILTGTKQLQDQYKDVFDLATVKGRGNFACPISPPLTADEAPCTVRHPCVHVNAKTPGCPYFDQKAAALQAPELVSNYAYWLAQANYNNSFVSPDLLICDEAHTVEEEIRRFATIPLRQRALHSVGLTWPKHDPADVEAWTTWAVRVLPSVQAKVRDAKRPHHHPSDGERRRIKAVLAVHRAVSGLTHPAFKGDGWVAIKNQWGVDFRPVWVSPLVPRLLLRHARRVLFLSATILSKDLFCHQLGLPEDQVEYIQAPSRFPKANRPLIYRPVGKVKANEPRVLDRLTEEVARVLKAHPNEKGIVHTVSYKVRDHVMASLRDPRLITHGAGDRERQLAHFKASPLPLVLISPSMSTGVDLPYDQLRFQVIAKIAFPDLGDPQIKQRMKLGPDGLPNPKGQSWYSWQAACTLVQAYGRGVRAEDDACTTYLLDGNWAWFRHAAREFWPGWFTEAVKSEAAEVVDVSVADLLAQIRGAPVPAL